MRTWKFSVNHKILVRETAQIRLRFVNRIGPWRRRTFQEE